MPPLPTNRLVRPERSQLLITFGFGLALLQQSGAYGQSRTHVV
jgi:hypothetical protein